MDQPSYQSYYLSRAAASRGLAQRAANPMIAAIHADLAARYDALIEQTAPQGDGKAPAGQTA